MALAVLLVRYAVNEMEGGPSASSLKASSSTPPMDSLKKTPSHATITA